MGIFLSLSYSKTFRIETINTLIHSHSSLKNHIPDSRPKWTKSIPSRFQTKTPQRPYPLGRHIPIWPWEDPPRGIIFAGPALQRCRCSVLHWISKTWVRVRVTPPNSCFLCFSLFALNTCSAVLVNIYLPCWKTLSLKAWKTSKWLNRN